MPINNIDGSGCVALGVEALAQQLHGIEKFVIAGDSGSYQFVLGPNAVSAFSDQHIDISAEHLGVATLSVDGSAISDSSVTMTLTGSNAGNILHGGSGADVITGGSGADVITGGGGGDILTGGGGNDTFVIDWNEGHASLAFSPLPMRRKGICHLPIFRAYNFTKVRSEGNKQKIASH